MITVNEVSKSFGSKTLFDNVSVKFTPGNRYGLTGPNGAGKSTFMKILTGDIEPTNRGTVTRPKKVGVLRQNQFEFDNERIIDTVMMGNATLWQALKERNELCNATEFTDESMQRLGELESIVADENGYMAEIEAAEILRGIGLSDDRHTELMSTLPTDMKFRVLLAQAVFGNPQALLLDEPTNFMDLDSIHWLEGFLKDYDGTLIVISHDRHFLNAVCTHIADIDYDTIIQYPGNYDDMVEQKMSTRSRIEADNRDKAKKIEQLQQFVSRFAAGQRSSQVQSRRKEMERLSPQELKRSNIQRPFVRFEQNKPAGREVVVAKGLNKSFDDNPVLKNINIEIMRGDRVAIIGGNGIGKTTLLRCLIGELEPDSGTVRWGSGMSWGYYPQDYSAIIPKGEQMVEWLIQFEPNHDHQIVRGLLGRMLFAGEEAVKSTEKLSGGESARLLMAKLMLEKHPVLIFDEPTNHLDLEAVNALGEGLSQFAGTVLLVSHDRDLISDVATRILSFTPDGLIDFPGTYEQYLEKYPLPETQRGREMVNAMQYRRFGRTELKMPVFSCGGMRYQYKWQDVAPDEVPADGQANLEATIHRALELGINHIETARGYGSSEMQLGCVLPKIPRESLIVQTKVGPEPTAQKFLDNFNKSLDYLQLEYVDLLAFHGINTPALLEQVLQPGGSLEAARQLQKEGRVRFVGFSTHAPCSVIVKAIETGEFDYVNLHWYFVNDLNWPAIEAATRQDMGVFIISPTDKGGMLQKPSDKMVELCSPLSPMQFNDLYCLARPEVHTLSIGAARPSDFDAHVEALANYSSIAQTIAPIEPRIRAEMERVLGKEWTEGWWKALPEHTEVPGDVNVLEILRIWTYARSLDLDTWGKSRYNLLGHADHWQPGNNAANVDETALASVLIRSRFAAKIPHILRSAHDLFGGDAQKRQSES